MKAQKINKKKKWDIVDIFITVLCTLAAVICIYPMVYVISCSISDPLAVIAQEVVLFPVGFSKLAYEMVLFDTQFWKSYANTIFYVFTGLLLTLFNTIAMAYPLTRPNLKGRKFLTYFLLITMYFNGGMIPTFLVVSKLGLYNTPWALILPGYSAFYVILCRTFMNSLPNELVESAFMDGANQFQTLLRIIIPLAKPVIAVISIYTIVSIWNSWFNASIYTTKDELIPIQLYLTRIMNRANFMSASAEMFQNMPIEVQQRVLGSSMAAKQVRYAAIVLVASPILAVYPFFRKHFVKGIMLGSLKG